MTLTQDSALWGPTEIADWQGRVHAIAAERDAVILAHNYQAPIIQDVAHHVGDSLALSRIAASSDASTIVFAGVHFMAETAKILSPDKRVLIPDQAAGCSLADTIDAAQLRQWKAEHPGAMVVSYVNTTAEVKALTDICCTSSNAIEVVRSIPQEREILFLPDQFLGAHVRRVTGRKNIQVWLGECHVHADISPSNLIDAVGANPDADLYVHPECGCTTSALWLASTGQLPQERTHILSTGAMLETAKRETSTKVLVATEIGMLHQLRQANPATIFEAVNPRAACPYMKLTTPEKIEACLGEPALTAQYEVDVPRDVAAAARMAVEKMVAIGTPGGGE